MNLEWLSFGGIVLVIGGAFYMNIGFGVIMLGLCLLIASSYD